MRLAVLGAVAVSTLLTGSPTGVPCDRPEARFAAVGMTGTVAVNIATGVVGGTVTGCFVGPVRGGSRRVVIIDGIIAVQVEYVVILDRNHTIDVLSGVGDCRTGCCGRVVAILATQSATGDGGIVHVPGMSRIQHIVGTTGSTGTTVTADTIGRSRRAPDHRGFGSITTGKGCGALALTVAVEVGTGAVAEVSCNPCSSIARQISGISRRRRIGCRGVQIIQRIANVTVDIYHLNTGCVIKGNIVDMAFLAVGYA